MTCFDYKDNGWSDENCVLLCDGKKIFGALFGTLAEYKRKNKLKASDFILVVFGAILIRMLKVAEGTKDTENRLVVIGVFSWTLAQVVVNIMAMTSLVPVTGITLPLLSYGGTSMVFIAFALGLVLQLSCYTSREVTTNEDISSRGRLGGTHYTSRRRSPRNSREKTSRRG